ncbi:rmlD substrate binding domain-containing protein [Hirsutella rhossiliensis]|uniref:RmlD substrate binding domain-containing protein n=1 Tax=Hirsutella rhossiliensis TaxID=111463 RepID=A0A9P8N1I9_9HYPO|nr:rmlD substrate binding domain-containing protein [Hirsutella rhossiliensis]KAH0965160.1 rmlD substrate binding domain-containing protein [Hirsutella rhossiliensis]
MTRRTVLVTGATGLLGREVAKTFELGGWHVKRTGYSRADGVDVRRVDLRNADELAKALDENKPQVIVHCAAEKAPDKVDKDPEGARALNVAASRSLAKLAASRAILVIYVSTDYVFPGTPGDAPYEADAAPKPANLYGQTKADGERAVLEEFTRAGKQGLAVALRVPLLYGHAETPAESAVNVLMDSVWKAQTEGARIKMDHWARRYPTNTEDVGRVCRDVAAKYLDAAERQGLPRILQFSSQDVMTKYDICQRFGEVMGLSIASIEPNTQGNDPNASAQRPYDCHLSTKELGQLGIDVSTCDFTAWWRREVGAFRK